MLKDKLNKADNRGGTALMIAAERGHKEIVKLLLEKCDDVNKPTKNGFTP